MEFDWIEWFGYLASLVVLISFTTSSIIKLRVINFIGCILFASFAYLIDSIPTIFVNLSIACINVYYLYKMYSSKEQFKMISVSNDSEYFSHFIKVNQDDIEKQLSLDKLNEVTTSFYMLRDNNIAGILAGKRDEQGVFTIDLDYVIPRYRDFKLGSYYYNTHPEFLKRKGINTLKTFANDDDHCFYLEKMGFKKQIKESGNTYIKRL